MYWDFPNVRAEDRLERSPALVALHVRLSATEAFASLGSSHVSSQIRLNTFDGRPAYRFRIGPNERTVYADTGEEQTRVDSTMAIRIASTWTGQAAAAATSESIQEVDQWTVQGALRNIRPLWKFSWPNGEQVYVSGVTGEVVQYTRQNRASGRISGPYRTGSTSRPSAVTSRGGATLSSGPPVLVQSWRSWELQSVSGCTRRSRSTVTRESPPATHIAARSDGTLSSV